MILISLCAGLKDNRRANEVLKDVDYVRITATYKDWYGERSYTEFLLLSYYSPTDHFIKVWTSTEDARVGIEKYNRLDDGIRFTLYLSPKPTPGIHTIFHFFFLKLSFIKITDLNCT